MIVFPNCKINIGLRITGKRTDAYHNLETIFYPIPLHDALEAVPSSVFSFSQHGMDLPEGKNICIKAYEIFSQRYDVAPLNVHLLKSIPSGAGLGGGSSDGAFMLKLLAELSHVKPSRHELEKMALELGSDCPFFIRNEPAFATGRGELFNPTNINLQGYFLTIINPGIHISTAAAFSSLDGFSETGSLEHLTDDPLKWRDIVINDFEPSVIRTFPEIGQLKNGLYEAGALFASMSGTGSTVYGIFRKRYEPLHFPNNYFVRSFPL